MVTSSDLDFLVIFPPFIVENSTHLSVMQMNCLAILLGEMKNEIDRNNLEYSINVDHYSYICNIDIRIAKREFNQMFTHYTSNAWTIELFSDTNDHKILEIIDSIDYDGTALKFIVTKQFKAKYTEFITHKGKYTNDNYKTYVLLENFIPLKSSYSKKLYLMCRKFHLGGFRAEYKWDIFCWRLQIPKSYTTAQIKKRILDHSCDEINRLTDIDVTYDFFDETVSGGKKPSGLKLKIKRKDAHTKEDITDNAYINNETDLSQDTLELLKFLEKNSIDTIEAIDLIKKGKSL